MFAYFHQQFFFVLRAVLSLPAWFFAAWGRQRGGRGIGDAPRILFIPQLTRIGDIVCATPAIRAVRRAYPNARIALLTTHKVRGILDDNPHIDGLILFKSADPYGAIREIQAERFDAAFSFSGTWLSSLLMLAGGIPRRVKLIREGRPLSELLTDWLNTERRVYRHHTSAPHHYLSMLSSIGIEGTSKGKIVAVTKETNAAARAFLSARGARAGDMLVGMSITAGNKIKEWGDEKFGALADMITATYPAAKILWLGGPGDAGRIEGVIAAREEKSRHISAVGAPLRELPALMNELELYIAVDTGPIYIAEALGVPLVDITGPVDPWEQPPHGKNALCVMPPAPFHPSSFVFKKAGAPDEHRHALAAITVPMVFHAAEYLLGNGGSRRAW